MTGMTPSFQISQQDVYRYSLSMTFDTSAAVRGFSDASVHLAFYLARGSQLMENTLQLVATGQHKSTTLRQVKKSGKLHSVLAVSAAS